MTEGEKSIVPDIRVDMYLFQHPLSELNQQSIFPIYQERFIPIYLSGLYSLLERE
jgi:hypothetical protein